MPFKLIYKKCVICNSTFHNQKSFKNSSHCFACGRNVCDSCAEARIIGVTPVKKPKWHKHKVSDESRICRECATNPQKLFLHRDIKSDFFMPAKMKKLIDELKNLVINVNRNFPISSSRQYYQNVYDFNLFNSRSDKDNHFNETHSLLRDNEDSYYSQERNPVISMEKTIEKCLKLSIANCQEMSEYCFLYFLYQKKKGLCSPNLKFSIVDAIDADHVFFCVYSDHGSHNDMVNNGVVCDPWYKTVYKFQNIEEYYSIKETEINLNYEDVKQYHSKYSDINQIRPIYYPSQETVNLKRQSSINSDSLNGYIPVN